MRPEVEAQRMFPPRVPIPGTVDWGLLALAAFSVTAAAGAVGAGDDGDGDVGGELLEEVEGFEVLAGEDGEL